MNSSLKKLFNYSLYYWRKFLLAILATIILAGIEAGIAWSVQPITDAMVDHEIMHWYVKWMWLLFFIAITFRALLMFVADYIANIISQNVVMKLRNELYTHFLALPRKYHDEVTTGASTTLITYNANIISDFCGKNIIDILQNAALVLGLFIALMMLSWQLCFFAIVLCLPIVFVVRHISLRIKETQRKMQSSMQGINHFLHETLRSISMIKSYDLDCYTENRFLHISHSVKSYVLKNIRFSGLSRIITHMLVALPPAVLIYLVINDLLNISAGVAIAVFVALLRIQMPIRRLANYNSVLQQVVVAAEAIFSTLSLDVERSDGDSYNRPHHCCADLTLENVSFSYGDKDTGIKNISFSISPGEKVAIVGPSGAGKSTLLKLIVAMYRADYGNVFLNNKDIDSINLKSLRKNVAYVSQESALFNLSVKDNICYGLDVAFGDLLQAVKYAGLEDVINELPLQYDSVIAEMGGSLSGGQQQRIAIARALVRNPDLLLLDEATSALDNITEKLVLDNISKNISATVIMVAHRLSSIINVDKVIVMHDGQIVDSGSHVYLLANCALYKNLYESQNVSKD